MRREVQAGGARRLAGRVGLALVLAAVAVASVGCDGDKKPVQESADAGGPDANAAAVLDPKLGAALAAAEKGAGAKGPQAKTPQSADGPPPNGIFADGAADKAFSPGQRPKVEIVNAGAEPRAVLTRTLEPGAKQSIAITVGVRQGQQRALPTIAFKLAAEVDKAKKGDAGAAGEPLHVTATVKSAKPLAPPGMQLPPQLEDAIGKLKGSEVRFSMYPDGVASDFQRTLAKGADPQTDLLLGSLVDTLSLVIAPVPDKPVGVGGYWMVTDRAQATGVDVVRYRVVHLDKQENGRASLSIQTRKYATSDKLDLPVANGGQKLSMAMFDAQGKGSIELGLKDLFPGSGSLEDKLQAGLDTGGGPQRQAVLEIDTNATIGQDAP